jgi:hypothetical protein
MLVCGKPQIKALLQEQTHHRSRACTTTRKKLEGAFRLAGARDAAGCSKGSEEATDMYGKGYMMAVQQMSQKNGICRSRHRRSWIHWQQSRG